MSKPKRLWLTQDDWMGGPKAVFFSEEVPKLQGKRWTCLGWVVPAPGWIEELPFPAVKPGQCIEIEIREVMNLAQMRREEGR